MNEKRASLAVENGLFFAGHSVGAAGEKGGDAVFNTAMTGYHEILTDPSYFGQVVVMTYPLIGNYGVAEEDDESDRGWAEAFVVKEMSSIPSNRRAALSMSGGASRLRLDANAIRARRRSARPRSRSPSGPSSARASICRASSSEPAAR